MNGPEFWAALLGSLIGGLFALLGVWLHMRHADNRARNLLLRHLRHDTNKSLRSYAHWRATWNKPHANGHLMTPPQIQPIALEERPEVDLLLLPDSIRERLFRANRRIAEFNATYGERVPVTTPVREPIEAARRAEEAVTEELENLRDAVARILKEPLGPPPQIEKRAPMVAIGRREL